MNREAANLNPWCRRPSTQASRFVDDPRVRIVLSGVVPDGVCDALREDVLTKKGWVQQGGDKTNPSGFSSSRFQLNVPKPSRKEKMGEILRKFSEALHFTPKGHTHLRCPCVIRGGSTQLWHLDNGHGWSLALLAALTKRAFEYAAVGGGITRLELEKGDCVLFTSCVWHRGVGNPADSVAFFAYFDEEHYEVPSPTHPDYIAAHDDNRAGFERMLDDDRWGELNTCRRGSPQTV